jgi:hypothetical protein
VGEHEQQRAEQNFSSTSKSSWNFYSHVGITSSRSRRRRLRYRTAIRDHLSRCRLDRELTRTNETHDRAIPVDGLELWVKAEGPMKIANNVPP